MGGGGSVYQDRTGEPRCTSRRVISGLSPRAAVRLPVFRSGPVGKVEEEPPLTAPPGGPGNQAVAAKGAHGAASISRGRHRSLHMR